jgi:hypothetical protein
MAAAVVAAMLRCARSAGAAGVWVWRRSRHDAVACRVRSSVDSRRRRCAAITLPPGAIADHVAAGNAHETDVIMAMFARDAYINDNRREFVGADAIRRFIEREIVGDNVTMDVREVIAHYGDTIVRPPTRATSTRPTSPTR